MHWQRELGVSASVSATGKACGLSVTRRRQEFLSRRHHAQMSIPTSGARGYEVVAANMDRRNGGHWVGRSDGGMCPCLNPPHRGYTYPGFLIVFLCSCFHLRSIGIVDMVRYRSEAWPSETTVGCGPDKRGTRRVSLQGERDS